MDGSAATLGMPPRRGSFQEDSDLSSTAISLHSKTPSRPSSIAGSDLALQSTNSNAAELNNAISATAGPIAINDDDDDEEMLTDDDPGFTKSVSSSRRQSMAAVNTKQTPNAAEQSPSSDGDLIEVNQSAFQLPLEPSDRAGKLKNRYVMPDGTVVNGKGLGRGRPGVKRGPKKSGLSREVTEASAEAEAMISTPSPSASSQPPAKSKPSSAKRKRTGSDAAVIKDEDEELDDFSRSSTPEYNPAAATLTRSGRQSQKPAIIVPTPPATASPATKRPALDKATSSPSIKKHPKIKPKVYRGREQFALCEHCLRQHGPPGNVMVFCDACNKCWHQRCHEPQISKEVVADTKAEWFCADCDRILHGRKKNKPGPKAAPPVPSPLSSKPAMPPMPSSPKILPRYGLPLIPGMSLTMHQRKEYLNSLSKEKLVEIVLHSANLAPNMPIFETPLHLAAQPHPQASGVPIFPGPPHPSVQHLIHPTVASPMPPPPPPSAQARASSTSQPQPQPIATTTPSRPQPTDNRPLYTHPTAHIPSKPNTQPPLPNLTDDDEGYYDDFDEMALLYPKPGQGAYDLALTPESTDLGIMLEGPDCVTFSHWVRKPGEIGPGVGMITQRTQ